MKIRIRGARSRAILKTRRIDRVLGLIKKAGGDCLPLWLVIRIRDILRDVL